MRKNILSLSIAAMIGGLGLAGAASAGVVPVADATTDVIAASALEVTPEGIGHILLVPYYSAQNGNATLLNIVNTDEVNGKVVKVRFRGASNSDDVFDFTLFLSPGDVWAGQVTENATTGVAAMNFADKSCTLPDAVNVKVDFATDRVNPAADVANETREGYVEILTMADVPKLLVDGKPNALYTATKHVNGVAPCRTDADGLAALNKLGTDLANEAQAFSAGVSYPTTGLFANWTIINVPEATAWAGAATSIVANTGVGSPPAAANIVVFPQKASAPAETDLSLLTADPLLVAGVLDIRNYDLPDLSTPYTGANAVDQAYALTAAIAKTSIKNEYITTDAVNASTDWVFSLPTRRYHVALDYAATKVGDKLTNTAIYQTTFTTGSPYFVKSVAASGETEAVKGNVAVMGASGKEQICVTTGIKSVSYDREEGSALEDDFVISPSTPAKAAALCGEVAVWSFNELISEPSALGATVARGQAINGFQDGWASFSIQSANPTGAPAASFVNLGLPILGSAFTKAVNPYVNGGVSGNYGANWEHRYSRVAAATGG